MNIKITEMILDDIPEWAAEAMAGGQFFRMALERIAELEAVLQTVVDNTAHLECYSEETVQMIVRALEHAKGEEEETP